MVVGWIEAAPWCLFSQIGLNSSMVIKHTLQEDWRPHRMSVIIAVWKMICKIHFKVRQPAKILPGPLKDSCRAWNTVFKCIWTYAKSG